MNDTQYVAIIHAAEIEPKYRHPTIFNTFDSLQSGEFLQLTNDHDPRPLQYQFMMEREGTFTWEYIEEGPELWRVKIGRK